MRRISRVISYLILITFLIEQVSYAADIKPQAVNVFQSQKLELGFRFPESVATIEDSWKAPSQGKTVYLLQDAHTNESGQINLAKTLDTLLKNDKDLKYIFVEAGVGDDSLSFLKEHATQAKRNQVAAEYLKKGILHGEEYLNLTSDHDFVIWGVEDLTLYQKAIDAYRAVVKDREKFQNYLSRIQATINALKPRIYGSGLLSFDEKHAKFQNEEISLTDYFEILTQEARKREISLSAFPHLKSLNNLKEKESKIDFRAANEEQQKAIESLPAGDQQELREALTPSVSKLGANDNKAKAGFYLLLEEKLLADRKENYTNLSNYFSYLKEAKALNPRQILEEQKQLENLIFSTLAKTKDELDLIHCQKNLRFLQKLFNLKLTPEEYSEYTESSRDFGIQHLTGFLNKKIMDLQSLYERASFLEEGYERIVKNSETFYELTKDRDEAFLKTLTEKMGQENQGKAVLITGGFHTTNLKALFKEKNISFALITPQVYQETNQKRYESLLLNQKIDPAFLSSGRTPMQSMARLAPIAICPADLSAISLALGYSPSAIARTPQAVETNLADGARLANFEGRSPKELDRELSNAQNQLGLIGAALADPDNNRTQTNRLIGMRDYYEALISNIQKLAKERKAVKVGARLTDDAVAKAMTTIINTRPESLSYIAIETTLDHLIKAPDIRRETRINSVRADRFLKNILGSNVSDVQFLESLKARLAPLIQHEKESETRRESELFWRRQFRQIHKIQFILDKVGADILNDSELATIKERVIRLRDIVYTESLFRPEQRHLSSERFSGIARELMKTLNDELARRNPLTFEEAKLLKATIQANVENSSRYSIIRELENTAHRAVSPADARQYLMLARQAKSFSEAYRLILEISKEANNDELTAWVRSAARSLRRATKTLMQIASEPRVGDVLSGDLFGFGGKEITILDICDNKVTVKIEGGEAIDFKTLKRRGFALRLRSVVSQAVKTRGDLRAIFLRRENIDSGKRHRPTGARLGVGEELDAVEVMKLSSVNQVLALLRINDGHAGVAIKPGVMRFYTKGAYPKEVIDQLLDQIMGEAGRITSINGASSGARLAWNLEMIEEIRIIVREEMKKTEKLAGLILINRQRLDKTLLFSLIGDVGNGFYRDSDYQPLMERLVQVALKFGINAGFITMLRLRHLGDWETNRSLFVYDLVRIKGVLTGVQPQDPEGRFKVISENPMRETALAHLVLTGRYLGDHKLAKGQTVCYGMTLKTGDRIIRTYDEAVFTVDLGSEHDSYEIKQPGWPVSGYWSTNPQVKGFAWTENLVGCQILRSDSAAGSRLADVRHALQEAARDQGYTFDEANPHFNALVVALQNSGMYAITRVLSDALGLINRLGEKRGAGLDAGKYEHQQLVRGILEKAIQDYDDMVWTELVRKSNKDVFDLFALLHHRFQNGLDPRNSEHREFVKTLQLRVTELHSAAPRSSGDSAVSAKRLAHLENLYQLTNRLNDLMIRREYKQDNDEHQTLVTTLLLEGQIVHALRPTAAEEFLEVLTPEKVTFCRSYMGEVSENGSFGEHYRMDLGDRFVITSPWNAHPFSIVITDRLRGVNIRDEVFKGLTDEQEQDLVDRIEDLAFDAKESFGARMADQPDTDSVKTLLNNLLRQARVNFADRIASSIEDVERAVAEGKYIQAIDPLMYLLSDVFGTEYHRVLLASLAALAKLTGDNPTTTLTSLKIKHSDVHAAWPEFLWKIAFGPEYEIVGVFPKHQEQPLDKAAQNHPDGIGGARMAEQPLDERDPLLKRVIGLFEKYDHEYSVQQVVDALQPQILPADRRRFQTRIQLRLKWMLEHKLVTYRSHGARRYYRAVKQDGARLAERRQVPLNSVSSRQSTEWMDLKQQAIKSTDTLNKALASAFRSLELKYPDGSRWNPINWLKLIHWKWQVSTLRRLSQDSFKLADSTNVWGPPASALFVKYVEGCDRILRRVRRIGARMAAADLPRHIKGLKTLALTFHTGDKIVIGKGLQSQVIIKVVQIDDRRKKVGLHIAADQSVPLRRVELPVTASKVDLGSVRSLDVDTDLEGLVLGRYFGESVVINEEIGITVVRVTPNKVRLAFQAPQSIGVDRLKVYKDKLRSQRDSQGSGARLPQRVFVANPFGQSVRLITQEGCALLIRLFRHQAKIKEGTSSPVILIDHVKDFTTEPIRLEIIDGVLHKDDNGIKTRFDTSGSFVLREGENEFKFYSPDEYHLFDMIRGMRITADDFMDKAGIADEYNTSPKTLGPGTVAFRLLNYFLGTEEDVNVMLTYKCPFNCKHCLATPALRAGHGKDADKQMLYSVFDQLAGFKQVHLVGTGEVFMYGQQTYQIGRASSDFMDVVRYAAERIGEVIIVTNGLIIPEDLESARAFFKQFPGNVSWLLSVDPYHEEAMSHLSGRSKKSLSNIIRVMEVLANEGLIKTGYNVRYVRSSNDSEEEKKTLLARFGLEQKSTKDPKRVFINSILAQGSALLNIEGAKKLSDTDLREHAYRASKLFAFIDPDGFFVLSDHLAYLHPTQRADFLTKHYVWPARNYIVGNITDETFGQIICRKLLGRNYYRMLMRDLNYIPDYENPFPRITFARIVSALYLYQIGKVKKARALLKHTASMRDGDNRETFLRTFSILLWVAERNEGGDRRFSPLYRPDFKGFVQDCLDPRDQPKFLKVIEDWHRRRGGARMADRRPPQSVGGPLLGANDAPRGARMAEAVKLEINAASTRNIGTDSQGRSWFLADFSQDDQARGELDRLIDQASLTHLEKTVRDRAQIIAVSRGESIFVPGILFEIPQGADMSTHRILHLAENPDIEPYMSHLTTLLPVATGKKMNFHSESITFLPSKVEITGPEDAPAVLVSPINRGARLASGGSRIKQFEELHLKVDKGAYEEVGGIHGEYYLMWAEAPLDLHDAATVREFGRLLELVGLAGMRQAFRTDETPRLIVARDLGSGNTHITGLMFFHYPSNKYVFIEFIPNTPLNDYLTVLVMSRVRMVAFNSQDSLFKFPADYEFNPNSDTLTLRPVQDEGIAGARLAKKISHDLGGEKIYVERNALASKQYLEPKSGHVIFDVYVGKGEHEWVVQPKGMSPEKVLGKILGAMTNSKDTLAIRVSRAANNISVRGHYNIEAFRDERKGTSGGRMAHKSPQGAGQNGATIAQAQGKLRDVMWAAKRVMDKAAEGSFEYGAAKKIRAGAVQTNQRLSGGGTTAQAALSACNTWSEHLAKLEASASGARLTDKYNEALTVFALHLADIHTEADLENPIVVTLNDHKPTFFKVDKKSDEKGVIQVRLLSLNAEGKYETLKTIPNAKEALAQVHELSPAEYNKAYARSIPILLATAAQETNMAIDTKSVRASLEHVLPTTALALINDEDVFEAQARILVEGLLRVQRLPEFKRDTFYLAGNFNAGQKIILDALIEGNGLSSMVYFGEPKGKSAIVRYLDTAEMTQMPERNDNEILFPVTGLEKDRVLAWYAVIREAGSLGEVYAMHFDGKKIDFDKVVASALPEQTFMFHNAHAVKPLPNRAAWKNVSENRVTLEELRNASFYMPLQKIAINLILQGARLALQAIGGSA